MDYIIIGAYRIYHAEQGGILIEHESGERFCCEEEDFEKAIKELYDKNF